MVDRRYKLGIFYFYRNIPASWFPKRIGYGRTFNFARLAMWLLILGVIVLIPLL